MEKAWILCAGLLLVAPCFAQNTAESLPVSAGVISQAAEAVKQLVGETEPLGPFDLAQRILLAPGVSLNGPIRLKQGLSEAHLAQAVALLDEHLAQNADDALALLLLVHAKWESVLRNLPQGAPEEIIAAIDAQCLPIIETLLSADPSREAALNLAVEMWMLRGVQLEGLEQYQPARDSFAWVVEHQPANLDGLEALAQMLEKTGEIAGAIAQYQIALEASPTPKFYLPLLKLLEAEPEQLELLERIWEAFLTDCPEHTEALLANSGRLFESGSYEAALETLLRGSGQVPKDPRFHVQIGNCYWSLGEYEASAAAFETALGLQYDPLVVSNLAGAYSELGEQSKGRVLWRKHTRLRPDDPVLAMQYGLALFEEQNYRGALEQYKKGEELQPENDLFFNRAGLCLFHLGDYAIAAKHVKQALELSSDPVYFNNLAIAYEHSGEVELAGVNYAKGLELFPRDQGLLENYTAFLLFSGEEEVALAQLQEAAEASGHPDLYIKLADLATTQGEYSIADNAYAQAIRLRPDEPWPILAYALFLAGLNRQTELEAQLVFAKPRLPPGDFAWIVDELGAYWVDSKKYTAGGDFMGRLSAAIPTEPKIYTAWALLLSLQGNNQRALETIRLGLRQSSETYSARYLEVILSKGIEGPQIALGLAKQLTLMPEVDASGYLLALGLLEELGELHEAVDTAKLALRRFPNDAEIFAKLAYSLYLTGANREVASLLEDGVYLRLKFADRDKLLGLGYLELGNYVKSAGYFLSATEGDPQNPELWARLGEAQFFQGGFDEAKQALDTALKLDPALVEGRLWLGLVLIELGLPAKADMQFKAVETSPYSPPMALAWIALGRGRLAVQNGQFEDARLLLDEASAYGAGVARFDLELAKTRRKVGRF